MTLTSLGILLIVIGVLLWAIMAALHRHTVALKSLQLQMESLLARQGADGGAAADGDHPAGRPRSAGKPLPRPRTESVDSSTR